MKHYRGLMNEYDCGCKIYRDGAGAHFIQWCNLHKTAPELLEMCKMALEQFKIEDKGPTDYSDVINPLKQAIKKATEGI